MGNCCESCFENIKDVLDKYMIEVSEEDELNVGQEIYKRLIVC
ncbi:hypothetical protein BCJMU10_4144 [Bacillus cereus]|nr:hypothetical protein BCJMU10_4144 [Bacillus cereus]